MPQKQKGKTFPLGNTLPTLHSRYRSDSIWNFCFDRRMIAPLKSVLAGFISG